MEGTGQQQQQKTNSKNVCEVIYCIHIYELILNEPWPTIQQRYIYAIKHCSVVAYHSILQSDFRVRWYPV